MGQGGGLGPKLGQWEAVAETADEAVKQKLGKGQHCSGVRTGRFTEVLHQEYSEGEGSVEDGWRFGGLNSGRY